MTKLSILEMYPCALVPRKFPKHARMVGTLNIRHAYPSLTNVDSHNTPYQDTCLCGLPNGLRYATFEVIHTKIRTPGRAYNLKPSHSKNTYPLRFLAIFDVKEQLKLLAMAACRPRSNMSDISLAIVTYI